MKLLRDRQVEAIVAAARAARPAPRVGGRPTARG